MIPLVDCSTVYWVLRPCQAFIPLDGTGPLGRVQRGGQMSFVDRHRADPLTEATDNRGVFVKVASCDPGHDKGEKKLRLATSLLRLPRS